jgi:hypothetical protein
MGQLTVPGNRRRVGRGACATAAGLALTALSLTAAGPATAADPVAFGTPSATSSFGSAIDFKQPVTLDRAPRRVELLLSTPGSIGPEVIPLAQGATAGASTLDDRIDLSGGQIVPNTTFAAHWRIVDADGRAWLGPVVHHVYADDRFTWKSLNGAVVRVHWYEGSQAFAQRALQIGDDAVAATAKLLGVTETDPIDFFIYSDQQAFYDALGPATRENVGGEAHPDIRTLFALITPDEIDASWVKTVVPHELTHVVFATAVDNPYHDPPHWLNEGLAVYLSVGYQASDRAVITAAVAAGSIIPLDGLAGSFPTTRDRFFLAYAESVSAVDRIVRVNGRDALVKLIRSYHDGVSDDEAFSAALQRDLAGFEADWLADFGATPPAQVGPRSAPAGPLPAGWSGPQPNPSFEIVGSQPPTTPGAAVPNAPARGEDALARFLTPSLSVLGLVLVIVLVLLGTRRLRRVATGGGAEPGGDNRLFGRGWAPDQGDAAAAVPGPDGPVGPGEPDGDDRTRATGEDELPAGAQAAAPPDDWNPRP